MFEIENYTLQKVIFLKSLKLSYKIFIQITFLKIASIASPIENKKCHNNYFHYFLINF